MDENAAAVAAIQTDNAAAAGINPSPKDFDSSSTPVNLDAMTSSPSDFYYTNTPAASDSLIPSLSEFEYVNTPAAGASTPVNNDSLSYFNFEELLNSYDSTNTVLNDNAVTQLFGSLEYAFEL